MARIRANNASGGGESDVWYMHCQTLAASATAQWLNTPVTPNKVYVTATGGNNRAPTIYTNVNQTTKQVDGNWYRSDDGANFTQETTPTFSVNGNNVNGRALSSVAQGVVFFITSA